MMDANIEAPFEMASLRPHHTGLPFVVWISVGRGDDHDVRVMVSRDKKAMPAEMISVAIRPDVHVVEGSMDAGEFDLLRNWIEQNRETLIAYWEGEIDTQDALDALGR